MGWTSYPARYYDRHGKIDRKAECDNVFTEDGQYGKWEVLKSSIKGSVYYAAVRKTRPSGESHVFCAICLTAVEKGEFYYKDMDESMGPGYYDCPASILDLLSPTENKSALEWRQKCREQAKNKNTLGRLPIGTVIEYTIRGQVQRAKKCAPAYQFKTPWWCIGPGYYAKKKDIPRDFTVIATA